MALKAIAWYVARVSLTRTGIDRMQKMIRLFVAISFTLMVHTTLTQTTMAQTTMAQTRDPMNDFACSIYTQLAKSEGNLFFSPYSLNTALAMTAEGARGETASQMGNVLKLPASMLRKDVDLPWNWSALHQTLGTLAERLTPKPVPRSTREKLAALRAQLDAANSALENPAGDENAYEAGLHRAETLAQQINQLQSQVDQYEFRSANALWVEQSFALEKPYVENIAKYYKLDGAKKVDFLRHADESRKTINDWVSAGTNQRIKELIAPGMIDESTRLVLTNAVYFLGEWSEPFKIENTKTEKFRLQDGTTTDAALMQARQSHGVKYAAFNADGAIFTTPTQINPREKDRQTLYPKDGFQVIELPYRGDTLSMMVILPMTPSGLAGVEANLSADHLMRWSKALEPRPVDVLLPKFKLESNYQIAKTLQELGMTRAFVNPANADGAQFDGISKSADPRKRLYIGAVVHKAFVEVNEKGAEAAAATAVIMLAKSAMPMMVDFTPTFRADHGFIFLIRDQQTGTVLFMGRLSNPG
jgi:serine protease inhibitor